MPDNTQTLIQIPLDIIYRVGSYEDFDEDEPGCERAGRILLDWWNEVAPDDRKGADHFEIFRRTKSGSWHLIALDGWDDREPDDFAEARSSAVWNDYLVEFRTEQIRFPEQGEMSDFSCRDMSGREVSFHGGPEGASKGWSIIFALSFARCIDEWRVEQD